MFKKICRWLCVPLFLSLFLINPLAAYDVRREVENADELLDAGQYLEAVGAYQEIADRVMDIDDKARAILRIGDIYGYYLNDYDIALKKYWIIKRDFSKTAHAENAVFNAGMIFYERRLYKEASYNFKTYLKNYPQGTRRETAEFMVSACAKPAVPAPPAEMKKDNNKTYKPSAEEIRILILADAREIRITAKAPFAVRDQKTKDPLATASDLIVNASMGTLRINSQDVSSIAISLLPQEGDVLHVNGKPYRGSLRIQRTSRGVLNIINDVDIEDYLCGVVPKEMSPLWPMEALKAQAVAARSFALYQKGKNRSKDYDVSASTNSQVYEGAAAEKPGSNQAVKDTKGVVLLYGGQPVLAYYHANSGGVTEAAKAVWTTDIPYLQSVPDNYSLNAPQSSWEVTLGRDVISQALSRKGLDIGSLDSLKVLDTSSSGRVTKIQADGSRGRVSLPGNDFRMKVNPSSVKSTLFQVIIEGDAVRFRGRGFGHGVGMSQWGACMMAREGRNFRDILQHYYRGVEIR